MSGGELLEGLRTSSISAAALILTALLLRAVFQGRMPQRLFCLLWDMALARLLIFSGLPSPVSIWRWLPSPLASMPGTSYAVTSGAAAPAGRIVTEGGAAVPGIPASPSVSLSDKSTAVAAAWLAVALALAAWFLWSHLRSRRIYGDSLPCEDAFVRNWLTEHPLRRPVQVRTSDRIVTPLTCGVLRPIILLPARMETGTALSFVLEHEYQHIRRFDTLRKGFLAAALCLHWFNPLVWILYVLCNRDMELACDEAVIDGGADRADYARSLLSLEERRGQWGLSGSHFSQNALEERIRSIMKHKRFSKAALIAVLTVMTVTVTVFASAAPEGKVEVSSGTGYVYDHFQAVEEDVMILSQGGKEGEKQYSVDGGRTWLSEEDYHTRYGDEGSGWQVEWWTAEGYALWLEEEKEALQSIIGERGYTGSEGWFTWDQKRVDETIALYEGILENIRNGALYSRAVTDQNGGAVEDTVLGSGTLNAAGIFSFDEKDATASGAVDEAALLEELKPFGIGGDADRITYNGQLVRRLVDGVPVGDNGYSIRYVYTNPDGVVDVHTLRSATRSSDGSYDPMGKLTGVAAEDEAGFDWGLIDSATLSAVQAAYAKGNGEGGTTFEEIFVRYAPYGLVYASGESGMGSLTWNGQVVKSFADLKPDGGVFSYQNPYAVSGLQVYAQYDAGGYLTGLRAE